MVKCAVEKGIYIIYTCTVKGLIPNSPNDHSGQGIYCFCYQKAVADRIRIFINGIFPLLFQLC